MTTLKDPVTARVPHGPEEHRFVLEQLERMLSSPLFSQSKRYAPFLRHVVEKTLDGHEDSLKERVLGVELFGRAPNYDSNNDPVVRVTAGEVRRRIAQYYDDPEHRNELRIELPVGTYAARFHAEHPAAGKEGAISPPAFDASEEAPLPLRVAAAPELPPALRLRFPRKLLVFSIAGAIAFAVLLWQVAFRIPASRSEVWGNLASAQSPLVITVGVPAPLSPPETAGNQLSARQHLRDEHFSVSDVQALLRIARVLDRRDIPYRVQSADGTTFADLRQSPAILLGGLDNDWTLRAQQNLRYRLESDGNGVDWISDARQPGVRKWLVDFNRPYSEVTTDYAILAFFHDPNTRQPTLIIAGMGENGTKAASEFITDDAQLRNALGAALLKSRASNFEIVLVNEVINGSSGAPQVLAREVW